jgi:hypothetical protein
MAKRPDLDALIVPKGSDSATAVEPGEGSSAKTYAHTLSFRLTAEQYRRLRRFVAGQEEKLGRRTTHQAIIEAALDEYFTKAGG